MGDRLVGELRVKLGAENVLDGLTERLARAHDASIYRLVPRAVARPRDIDDIRALLEACRAHGVGLTFRAAGTSLSGQAVTEGVLAELGPTWRKARATQDGALIISDPGVTGGHLNRLLAPHGRRIGPDPASIASAMIGGIVANNASGMCCGTTENAYRTLEAMKIVLADGTAVDTARDELPRAVAAGLLALRERALRHADRIRAKYAIKNTMGYCLNALVDFARPMDILAHLMVGSEGTLGFIAEVTLRTVVEPPLKATAVASFDDLDEAAARVAPLAAMGAAVVEIMDSPLALLIEFHETDRARLDAKVAALPDIAFTEDPALRAHYWTLRKGLFPRVGALRPPGTAVIIEDVCVPPARLADAVKDLRALLAKHEFSDGVIFGHAKDGNLHFVLSNDFAAPGPVARYAAMMDELAELVVGKYAGSLKAEHGTGRNMAPFVKYEWGEELYALMRDVKRLLDPDDLLNPGVLLSRDARSHLAHLKAMPAVDPLVDKCIECGFCEKVCPSRDLSLTPRQRIAIQREAALGNTRRLQSEFEWAGVDTCAGDGLCATVCPVGIDTGAYMRQFRARRHGAIGRRAAGFVARHMNWVKVPRRKPKITGDGPRVVVFEACVSKVMDGGGAVHETLARCGYTVVPASGQTLCCGQPFESKGYFAAAEESAAQLVAALRHASDGGKLPIVCDTSPCTSRLHALRDTGLEIFDFPTFMARRVLPTRTAWPKFAGKLVVHPTCSTMKSGEVDDLVTVARAFCDDVALPLKAGCCGFAGDKGFTVPELTRSATREEAEEVRAIAANTLNTIGVTTCKTCALGMARATSISYESLASVCVSALRSGEKAALTSRSSSAFS